MHRGREGTAAPQRLGQRGHGARPGFRVLYWQRIAHHNATRGLPPAAAWRESSEVAESEWSAGQPCLADGSAAKKQQRNNKKDGMPNQQGGGGADHSKAWIHSCINTHTHSALGQVSNTPAPRQTPVWSAGQGRAADPQTCGADHPCRQSQAMARQSRCPAGDGASRETAARPQAGERGTGSPPGGATQGCTERRQRWSGRRSTTVQPPRKEVAKVEEKAPHGDQN